MSRFVSVCLCAVLAFVSVTGVNLLLPSVALAATGTLTMETPLHVEPDPSTPLVALLPEGTEVTIDGPPVDGFYPVTVNGMAGWMRGEMLSLTKDVPDDVVEGESSPVAEETNDVPIEDVPIAQEATDTTLIGEPVPAAELPVDSATSSEWTDPAQQTQEWTQATAPETETASAEFAQDQVDVDPTIDDPAAAPPPAETQAVDPAAAAPATGDWVEPAPAAPVATAVPATTSDPATTTPADVAPVPDATQEPTTQTLVQPSPTASPATSDPAAVQPGPAAAPVATEPAAAPVTAPVPTPAPTPTPVPAPVGPAGVLVDMPVYYNPDPGSGLVFTVPAGSTVERTGEMANGFASVRYKEVVGWSAADQMAEPSDFASETPEETAVPVDTREPKPGSGVAFATVDMSLRSEPTANSEPITIVPAGSRLVLTGVMEGEFQRVTYGDLVGWISNDYLNNPESPAPNGQASGSQENYSRKQIVRYITQAANEYNQSPEDMLRVAQCESNLDPYAVNPSGSYGLFQFIRSTWKSTPYGKQDIFDPQANASAAAWMWSQGRKSEWVCQ